MNILQYHISLIQSQIQPAGHQLPSKAKRKVWIIAINGEEPITAQVEFNELNHHQTPRGKFKVNIIPCKRNIYQRTYIEDICYRYDQVRPEVSHLEVSLPKKLPTPKNIGKDS